MFIIDKALTPPPPRKQVPFDIGEVHFQAPVVTQNAQNVHDGAQSAQRPAAPQSEKPEIVHKNAQSAQPPYRREAPKVGRNEPCPCGSNLKLQHCSSKGQLIDGCITAGGRLCLVTQASDQCPLPFGPIFSPRRPTHRLSW